MRLNEIRTQQEAALQQLIAERRQVWPEPDARPPTDDSDDLLTAAISIGGFVLAVLVVLGAIAWRLWEMTR
jgi:hypothetical protein